MTLGMSGATPSDAGPASGLVSTSAQVGGALGLAVLATLSTTHSVDLVKTGTPVPQALTSGYHFAFWVAGGLVGAAIGVAVAVVRPTGDAAQDRAPDGELTQVDGSPRAPEPPHPDLSARAQASCRPPTSAARFLLWA